MKWNSNPSEFQKDQEDKRRLRGKYAPKTGTCRVCGGKVIAEIASSNDGRIGGPPRPCYIYGWHCEECLLVYHGRPEPKDPVST